MKTFYFEQSTRSFFAWNLAEGISFIVYILSLFGFVLSENFWWMLPLFVSGFILVYSKIMKLVRSAQIAFGDR